MGDCRAAGVPVFVKQLGARPEGMNDGHGPFPIELRDRKGGHGGAAGVASDP